MYWLRLSVLGNVFQSWAKGSWGSSKLDSSFLCLFSFWVLCMRRFSLVFHAHSAHSAQLNLIFSSAFALSTYLFCLLSFSLCFSLIRSLANTVYHSPPSFFLLSSLSAVNCLHTIALLPVSSCRTQLLLVPLLLLCLLLLLYCLPHLQVICWPAPPATPASGLNFWRGLFVRQD